MNNTKRGKGKEKKNSGAIPKKCSGKMIDFMIPPVNMGLMHLLTWNEKSGRAEAGWMRSPFH